MSCHVISSSKDGQENQHLPNIPWFLGYQCHLPTSLDDITGTLQQVRNMIYVFVLPPKKEAVFADVLL